MSAKWKRVLGWLLPIVLFDQLSKVAVDRTMPLYHSIPIIDGFFNLTYVRNTGAAFGIFAGAHEVFRLPVLLGVSFLAIAVLLWMLKRLRADATGLITAFAFILGGALGNLMDRFYYGEVVDFFDFYFSGYHWPAFNIADSFITLGVGITVLHVLRAKGEDPFAPR